uniref:Uncharacterized protein n=1 Tax=Anguilla anguilla TaxID=7936 RepID=A0A0E9V3X3_ANGAN
MGTTPILIEEPIAQCWWHVLFKDYIMSKQQANQSPSEVDIKKSGDNEIKKKEAEWAYEVN